MILTARQIRNLGLIDPCQDRHVVDGFSAGLSLAGYDVTSAPVNGFVSLLPGQGKLFAVAEKLILPDDILARVCSKSSWARVGVVVGNVVAEPGWRGFLTLRLTNHGELIANIGPGMPLAQVIFEKLAEPADPYRGKYQDQPQRPVDTIREGT